MSHAILRPCLLLTVIVLWCGAVATMSLAQESDDKLPKACDDVDLSKDIPHEVLREIVEDYKLRSKMSSLRGRVARKKYREDMYAVCFTATYKFQNLEECSGVNVPFRKRLGIVKEWASSLRAGVDAEIANNILWEEARQACRLVKNPPRQTSSTSSNYTTDIQQCTVKCRVCMTPASGLSAWWDKLVGKKRTLTCYGNTCCGGTGPCGKVWHESEGDMRICGCSKGRR